MNIDINLVNNVIDNHMVETRVVWSMARDIVNCVVDNHTVET